ncbi:MAG: phospholipid/cholesterol/gamma-HCH transport system permease protein [Halieaceae bacterium]|jgi:phospholipid/cholesterol/gamma-HCH transport system permease protein
MAKNCMTDRAPGFKLDRKDQDTATLSLSGDWIQGQHTPDFADLHNKLRELSPTLVELQADDLGRWDSILMAFLLQCSNYCRKTQIGMTTDAIPEGAQRLLRVATAVEPHERPGTAGGSWPVALNPMKMLTTARRDIRQSMAFIGEVAIALLRLLHGKANTRFSDFKDFCYQAGPDAFAIISLTGVLVGMILGYLGAVQLQQFGAEIYVADLVVIGMLREMGVLMTAVVMAGRTGAAYAAQLGTMQTNEEIDAITTMGISPIEFLVVPRMLALVVMMPLLTIYADLLGILGGGIVAGGMGITPLQYINQAETAVSLTHFLVGMIKSLVFAVLIAVAGCRSGINSGRSSAAVGQAATEAVVTAIIYLIVADAAINIIFQQLGI